MVVQGELVTTAARREFDWQTPLAERGILDAALAMGWYLSEDMNTRRWEYPLFGEDGAPVLFPIPDESGIFRRWVRRKAIKPGARIKVYWHPEIPDDKKKKYAYPYYYFAQPFGIVSDAKRLWVLSGEPDTCTGMTVFGPKDGKYPIVSFFGELRIPESFPLDLIRWGVKEVCIIPDLDEAGQKFAAKMRDYCAMVGIKLVCYRLPEYLGEKGDLGKLWIACEFDHAKFRAAFKAMEIYEPQGDGLRRKKLPVDDKPDYYKPELYEAMAQALLSRPGFKEHGDWVNGPSIFRDDRHVSWGLFRKTGRTQDFATDEFHTREEIAAKLGIDPETYRNEEYRPPKATAAAKVEIAPAEFEKRNVKQTLQGTAGRYRRGEVSGSGGIIVPFSPLHRFGGNGHAIAPGTLVVIAAPTAGGKTTTMLSWALRAVTAGDSTIISTSEWGQKQLEQRLLHMVSGVSSTVQRAHELWCRGLPETRSLTEEELVALEDAERRISDWPGEILAIPQEAMVSGDMLLAEFDKTAEYRHKNGQKTEYFDMDYIQLIPTRGSHDRFAVWEEFLVNYQRLCAKWDAIGIAGSQLRKRDGTAVQFGGSDVQYDVNALYGITGNAFKFGLGIQPQFDDGKVLFHVIKNSDGISGGNPAELQADFTHSIFQPAVLYNVNLAP